MYQLQPSVPSLRSHKRSRRRKKGQRGHLPGLPEVRGDTVCSQLCQPSPPPPCTYGPRASGLRVAIPKLEPGCGASGSRSAPGMALRVSNTGWRHGQSGGSLPLPPPPPQRAPRCSQRRCGDSFSPRRRALPAEPAALGHAPHPWDRPPAGGLGPPVQRSKGEPPARACGLVGVT